MIAELEREREAICLESGVSAVRAKTIAKCEGFREVARAGGVGWRCTCGAHQRRTA